MVDVELGSGLGGSSLAIYVASVEHSDDPK